MNKPKDSDQLTLKKKEKKERTEKSHMDAFPLGS